MLVYEAVIAGVFGLIVGSFLNVVVLRHNTGRSLLGRSGCLSCRSKLTPEMLIPVFSWMLQRRRCVSCGTKISWQYPLVEISTALLFSITVYAQLPLITTAFALVILAFLVCIATYDIKHTIIPDKWVYTVAFIALCMRLSGALQTQFPINDVAVTLLVGPIVALPLLALWFFTRGRGIGLGDAKLGLVIGWFLGVTHGLAAVMLSFVIGAVISVFILLPMPYYERMLVYCGLLHQPRLGAFTMKSEVPFGPFLIAGTLLVWFSMIFGVDILTFVWGDFS